MMRRYELNKAMGQRGASLFVSLIMLIVLTLMGIVAMKTSTLEEKISSGSMDQNLAFQAAESALRDAEIYINANLTQSSGFNAACNNGLCLPSTTSTPVWDGIANWTTSPLPIVFGTATATPALPDVAIQPRYLIELLPNLPVGVGGSGKLGAGSGPTAGTAFRITAMGWGKRTGTQVMLQTIYVKV